LFDTIEFFLLDLLEEEFAYDFQRVLKFGLGNIHDNRCKTTDCLGFLGGIVSTNKDILSRPLFAKIFVQIRLLMEDIPIVRIFVRLIFISFSICLYFYTQT